MAAALYTQSKNSISEAQLWTVCDTRARTQSFSLDLRTEGGNFTRKKDGEAKNGANMSLSQQYNEC